MKYFEAVYDKTHEYKDHFVGKIYKISLIEKIEKALGIAKWYNAKLPYPEDNNDFYFGLKDSEKEDRVLVARATCQFKIHCLEIELIKLKNLMSTLNDIELRGEE